MEIFRDMTKISCILAGILALVLISSLPLMAQTTPPEGYQIRYNDVIDVSLFGNPDLHKQAIVPPDGIISFALIGEIKVMGLTARELEQKLQTMYATYLVNPVVSVSLGTFEAKKVYVIGEVHNPGPIPYDSTRTLADYLILAGGTTPSANLKKCLIMSSDAPDQRQEINLNEFVKEGKRFEIPIHPDDTVYIPRKSPYIISGWAEWSQFLNIILGVTTLYLIITRG
jgi:polysaccharide export outer membrane protein